MISDLDIYLFGHGTHYEIYKKLGAHPETENGKKGFSFAVWAPRAVSVSVVGDFNSWDPACHVMEKLPDCGIFRCFVPGLTDGSLYKFSILTVDGRRLLKADPYAFAAELRPGTASKLYAPRFRFSDGRWMAARRKKDPFRSPLSVYELHLASWMRDPGAAEDGFHSYRELARRVADYVRDMGYTHVELIGIAEHPLDASWGYQVTGYYAPTARHGSPDDFKYFINYLHQQGIGVILDWVPAHFPKDAFGLAEFDGSPLYEYADPRLGEHPDWGTKVFNWGLSEVSCFLIGSALHWVEEYHLDGLRVDAVASMLYRDYGRKDGEWLPNEKGGRENTDAIEFFRHLNSILQKRCPGFLTIAEESTAWPGVTAAPEHNGLGFSFKWNMGFMHDFLDYMQQDPLFRKGCHHKMTFAMTYAHAENFILVLSHDEVVHLKRSLLEKMPGTDAQKFASLKAGYAFFMTHPGKKLLFMGQDFGQRREWCEGRELDWFLLADENHRSLQAFYRDLLHLYRREKALYSADRGFGGFAWINADDADRSIFSYMRFAEDKRHPLIIAVNFTPVSREDYCVGVPMPGSYRLLFTENGLNTVQDAPVLKAEKKECDGQPWRLACPLNGYGIAVFKCLNPRPYRKEES